MKGFLVKESRLRPIRAGEGLGREVYTLLKERDYMAKKISVYIASVISALIIYIGGAIYLDYIHRQIQETFTGSLSFIITKIIYWFLLFSILCFSFYHGKKLYGNKIAAIAYGVICFILGISEILQYFGLYIINNTAIALLYGSPVMACFFAYVLCSIFMSRSGNGKKKWLSK
jgi:uncharacterized membrane protein